MAGPRGFESVMPAHPEPLRDCYCVIKGLKIILTFHPLSTLPLEGGGTRYNPLSPGGRGQG